MPPPPEHELLQQVDWVRALAARLVFDRGHRDDLEQEIWHAALAHRAAQPGVPLRAWLTGIGKHLAALLRRSDVRRTRREHAAARSDLAKSAAEVAEHAELQRRLLAAVHALPEPMRDVVLLRFHEGLPPRAIAAQLQVPVATVRTRLQRALERLREQLDADFGDRRAWALAFAAVPRPREVAAAAGAFPTFTHIALAAMNTNKLLAAATALAVLAAIPAAMIWSGSPPPAGSGPQRRETIAAVPDTALPTSTAPDAAATREAVAAPERALRGRVVDAHGAAIAGATVRKMPVGLFEERVESGELAAADAAATTAGDGTFVLSAAGAKDQGVPVATEHADYIAREEATPCSFTASATIVMLRTHQVPLVVECIERTSRVPVPRFRVTGSTALQTRFDGRSEQPTYALSVPDDAVGANGTWHGTARFVEGMPFDVRVRCSGHGSGEWSDGSDARLAATLHPVPNQPLHVVIEVDFDQAERLATRVQRGRIVAATTNEPLAGIDIVTIVAHGQVTHLARWVQSRADGSFAIALPKHGAACQLRFEHDDWQTENVTTNVDEQLVVRLHRRASLQVQVLGSGGAPLPRAHVLVTGRPDEHFHRRARTDDAGGVTLTGLLAGRYTVYVVPNRSAPDEHAIANASYALHPGQQVTATLEVAPSDAALVTGRVRGGPAGLTAAFIPYGGEGRWGAARLQGDVYDAGAVRPGDYLVLLLAANDDDDHLPRALLPKVTVQGAGQQVIDLPLPTGFVRGRITTKGAPAKLRVLAVPELPPDGVAADLLGSAKVAKFLGVLLGADGAFELKHVADGSWLLQVRDGATIVAQRAITVQGSLDVGDWTIER